MLIFRHLLERVVEHQKPFEEWIKEINWEVSEVTVNATVEQVKNSPEYQSNEYINDDYEQILTNYYGRFITRK